MSLKNAVNMAKKPSDQNLKYGFMGVLYGSVSVYQICNNSGEKFLTNHLRNIGNNSNMGTMPKLGPIWT